MEKQLEKLTKNIRTLWPGAQVSVIKSDRDKVGPVLSVRNKNIAGLEKLSRSPDHVVIEIDPKDDNHVLVIPLNQPGIQPYAGV